MKLRERLKGSIPRLYAAFEHSWEIAHEEWLPAVGPTKGSFNSYPHLRNLENYLERICADYEHMTGAGGIPLLSPFEVYVMLSAILFHDIGRAITEPGHGSKSSSILEEEYATLGIPSKSLAETIGKIVAFHDLPTKDCDEWLLNKLANVCISPYGEVRQRACAVLLRLIDELDAASTRVVPPYVVKDDVKVIGMIRRAVSAVQIDVGAGMVKIILSSDLRNHPLSSSPEQQQLIWRDEDTNTQAVPGADKVEAEFKKANIGLTPWRCPPPLFQAFDVPQDGWDVRLSLLARDLARLPDAAGTLTTDKLPRDILLALLVKTVWEGGRRLWPSRHVLHSIAVPTKTWLLEYDEHLYNANGEETFEPVFYKEYLERIADAMWHLSVSVFGHTAFSYETLAAQVREPDVERVRRAVHRLFVVCEPMRRAAAGPTSPFLAGRDHWRWSFESVPGKGEYRFSTVSDLKKAIESLMPPCMEE